MHYEGMIHEKKVRLYHILSTAYYIMRAAWSGCYACRHTQVIDFLDTELD
jgi:hypothetical protein